MINIIILISGIALIPMGLVYGNYPYSVLGFAVIFSTVEVMHFQREAKRLQLHLNAERESYERIIESLRKHQK
jgi:hypothetical protein